MIDWWADLIVLCLILVKQKFDIFQGKGWENKFLVLPQEVWQESFGMKRSSIWQILSKHQEWILWDGKHN